MHVPCYCPLKWPLVLLGRYRFVEVEVLVRNPLPEILEWNAGGWGLGIGIKWNSRCLLCT